MVSNIKKTRFFIHKYIQNGNYIVLDVNSGGVHVCDETAYRMIDFLEPPLSEKCPEKVFNAMSGYSEEEINECYTELFELYEANALFSPDGYEEYAETKVLSPVKALCLHVAHDCNLRCKYCFAATGDFGTGRILMTPETGRRAIDFLLEGSGERQNLELDFFGGEPLMAWETVRETVKYAREREQKYGKNFQFTLTTNGLLLDDEKTDFINREISNIVLSLDGRREINDFMRPTPNGSGSYDIILPKFKKLTEKRINKGRTDYYIRGTFTARNLDFTKDILAIANEGFKHISVEPAVGGDGDFEIKNEHIPRIKDEYDRLFDIMKDNAQGFNFFHFMIDLNQGPCAIKRLRGCGAGNEYLAVTPNGDIFPCHQFAGIESQKMGNIYTLSSNREEMSEIKEYFSKTHIYSKKECGECWAKFYCGGGCNAAGFLYEGDMRKPHGISCELMKKRIECAVALKCL